MLFSNCYDDGKLNKNGVLISVKGEQMEDKKLTLFGLAWPIFIETALFMLLGIVDVFVLSQYNDLAASAVSAANQATSITTIVFSAISTASAVLISQYLGAKKGATPQKSPRCR